MLSNIILNELDKELENRGHRFVRYADDCNIYVKSAKAGERVKEGVTSLKQIKLQSMNFQESILYSKESELNFRKNTFQQTKEVGSFSNQIKNK